MSDPTTPSNTGARLRSLYDHQGGTGENFATKVSAYVTPRPDYPAVLFDTLRTVCHLQRVLSDPLHVAPYAIFAQYGGAKRVAMLAHDERSEVPAFFGSSKPLELKWPHAHYLDEAALLSLVFSRSYMPDRAWALGQQASQRVRVLFGQLAINGSVAVRYTTVAILGRPQ